MNENATLMDRICNCKREITRWKRNSDTNSRGRITRLKVLLEIDISKLHQTQLWLRILKGSWLRHTRMKRGFGDKSAERSGCRRVIVIFDTFTMLLKVGKFRT